MICVYALLKLRDEREVVELARRESFCKWDCALVVAYNIATAFEVQPGNACSLDMLTLSSNLREKADIVPIFFVASLFVSVKA